MAGWRGHVRCHPKSRPKDLAREANKLAQALLDLDLDCRFAVAGRLLQPNADTGRIGPSFRPTQQMDRTLENCPARLRRLAAGATQVANDWVPTPMREGMLKRYLVLQDLAAIFEWATGIRGGAKGSDGRSRLRRRRIWPVLEFPTHGMANDLRYRPRAEQCDQKVGEARYTKSRGVALSPQYQSAPSRMADSRALAVQIGHWTRASTGHS